MSEQTWCLMMTENLEKDRLRQTEGWYLQSRRNEWSNNGSEGTRQGEIQAVGSDTSSEE